MHRIPPNYVKVQIPNILDKYFKLENPYEIKKKIYGRRKKKGISALPMPSLLVGWFFGWRAVVGGFGSIRWCILTDTIPFS